MPQALESSSFRIVRVRSTTTSRRLKSSRLPILLTALAEQHRKSLTQNNLQAFTGIESATIFVSLEIFSVSSNRVEPRRWPAHDRLDGIIGHPIPQLQPIRKVGTIRPNAQRRQSARSDSRIAPSGWRRADAEATSADCRERPDQTWITLRWASISANWYSLPWPLPGTNLAGPLPGLRALDIRVPERPRAALARPDLIGPAFARVRDRAGRSRSWTRSFRLRRTPTCRTYCRSNSATSAYPMAAARASISCLLTQT